MKTISLLMMIVVYSLHLNAQNADNNTAENMVQNNTSGVSIGGYAQIDYNQPFVKDKRSNGTLDVHRMVMLFGYNFNKNTSFVTEIEYEHVSELYVEQAFLNHKFTNWLNFRAGLLLIPMGILNEYHEPVTYNGVERPVIDNNISPTTWRELGAGFAGRFDGLGMKYQLYVVNGFSSYATSGTLSGKTGLRGGRQKGAESFISAPNLSFKLDYYNIPGLNLGVAGYMGDTQSKLYNGIDKNDNAAMAKADSSVVGVNMLGVNASYSKFGFAIKGQYYLLNLKNTDQYNTFTKKDLGKQLTGYYVDLSYAYPLGDSKEKELVPFIRYESLDTHAQTEGGLVRNDAYNLHYITTGLGLKLAKGAMLKIDYQWFKSKFDTDYTKQLNAGVAIWF